MEAKEKKLKCSYCAKEIEGEPVTRTVYINHGNQQRHFCSKRCAMFCQCSAEG